MTIEGDRAGEQADAGPARPPRSEETVAIEQYRRRLVAEGYAIEERAAMVDGFVEGWRARGGS